MRTVDEIRADIARTSERAELYGVYERELRDALLASIPTADIEAWVQAREEGRVVVLPCKIGDTVLIDAEIMGCDIGKMPYKVVDVVLEVYGDWGGATQHCTITRAAAEFALAVSDGR